MNSQAQFDQAFLHFRRGDWSEAIRGFARILQATSDEPVELLQLMGLALAKSGDSAKALPFFQRVVGLREESPSAGSYLNLGNAYFALNQAFKAEECFRKATVLEPSAHHAWGNLGLVLKRQGKRQQAIVSFQRAHQLAPRVIAYPLNCGNTLADLGHLQQALQVLNALCKAHPECGLALVALGRVLLASGQGWEALVFLKKACELEPQKAQFRLNYGAALAITGHVDEPLAHFREAVRLEPNYWVAWVELGNLLCEVGQLSASQQCFETVLKSQSTHQGALSGLASLYNRSGRYEEALDLLQPFVDLDANRQVNTTVAIATASNGLRRPQLAIPVLRKALSLTHTKPEQALIWHALARSLDQTECFDEAFSAYAQSNALRNLSFDPVRHIQETSQTIAAWSQSTLAQQPSSGIDSEAPIFVVGMPRSGTSLVEQILSGHSSVYGAGELEFVRQVAGQLGAHGSVLKGLGQCQREALTKLAQSHLTELQDLSPGALRITDKMPGNFLYLGLIQQLYPKARIIHCQRAMLDTCISCFRQNFTASYAYTTRLDWLAVYYKQYERLMAHWKSVLNLDIYELNYESLVQDSENEIRRLVDFCGLEMEPACLAPHLNSRVVITASQAQVREPIHTRSIGSAMRYRFHLGPLLGVEKAA